MFASWIVVCKGIIRAFLLKENEPEIIFLVIMFDEGNEKDYKGVHLNIFFDFPFFPWISLMQNANLFLFHSYFHIYTCV